MPCLDNSFDVQEDALVIKLVKEYGDKSWVVIAPHVKTRCSTDITALKYTLTCVYCIRWIRSGLLAFRLLICAPDAF